MDKTTYHEAWNSMNEISQLSGELIFIHNIMNDVNNLLEKGKHFEAKELSNVTYVLLKNYIQKFDTKFNIAWENTISKIKVNGNEKVDFDFYKSE